MAFFESFSRSPKPSVCTKEASSIKVSELPTDWHFPYRKAPDLQITHLVRDMRTVAAVWKDTGGGIVNGEYRYDTQGRPEFSRIIEGNRATILLRTKEAFGSFNTLYRVTKTDNPSRPAVEIALQAPFRYEWHGIDSAYGGAEYDGRSVDKNALIIQYLKTGDTFDASTNTDRAWRWFHKIDQQKGVSDRTTHIYHLDPLLPKYQGQKTGFEAISTIEDNGEILGISEQDTQTRKVKQIKARFLLNKADMCTAAFAESQVAWATPAWAKVATIAPIKLTFFPAVSSLDVLANPSPDEDNLINIGIRRYATTFYEKSSPFTMLLLPQASQERLSHHPVSSGESYVTPRDREQKIASAIKIEGIH